MFFFLRNKKALFIISIKYAISSFISNSLKRCAKSRRNQLFFVQSRSIPFKLLFYTFHLPWAHGTFSVFFSSDAAVEYIQKSWNTIFPPVHTKHTPKRNNHKTATIFNRKVFQFCFSNKVSSSKQNNIFFAFAIVFFFWRWQTNFVQVAKENLLLFYF